MFEINQTSTQDSNVLTIFQMTYWGVDLVISILIQRSCKDKCELKNLIYPTVMDLQ